MTELERLRTEAMKRHPAGKGLRAPASSLSRVCPVHGEECAIWRAIEDDEKERS